jgi:tetratricopeptide (TPR) repeat protein
VLILRIRHAETALADGRLDEAFELVREPKLRGHRRGQDLATRLVEAFAKRGREHLTAGRYTAALTDCEKAQQLAGDQPQLIALRSEAMDAATNQRRTERMKANAVAAARDEIDNGRLAAGERLLVVASVHDTRAGQLLQELGQRHNLVDSAVKGADDALDRDDIDAALVELDRARHADRSDKRIKQLSDRLKIVLRDRLNDAIEEGRLDRADSLGQRLIRVDEQGAESQHLLAALSQCKAAWDRIDHGRVHDAEEICRRLTVQFPKAKWITEACKHLSAASDSMESLRTGPLGLLTTAPQFRHDAPTQAPSMATRGMGASPMRSEPRPEAVHGRGAHATEGLPSKFIVQVDGAGSCMVLRQSTVTIGPVSSDRIPDIGLIAEAGAPVATIERADEDYFLRGSVLAVNDKPAANKLLVSGDRISLTPRCRVSFVTPSAASTTAVLDLIGARFPRADVRRVVLLDRELVIGPGMSSHMRCDTTPEPIVLHVRDNRLFCRSSAEVEVNGQPMDREKGIPVGANVRVGLVSFVVTQA